MTKSNDRSLELFQEAMRMSYKFSLWMAIIISIVAGSLSYCIIKYNTAQEFKIEATQDNNINSTQEVKNG